MLLARKLIRDLLSRKIQSLLLVSLMTFAVGISIAMAQSAEDLHLSYKRTYRNMHFADLSVHTLPFLENLTLTQVEGVTRYDMRLLQDCRINLRPGAKGLLIGINATRRPLVNDLVVVKGHYFDREGPYALVEAHFADARDLKVGDWIDVIVNENHLFLRIKGIVISPEYLFVIGDPKQIFPDEASFGALFVPLGMLQRVLNMTGMVNDILLQVEDPEAMYRQLVENTDDNLSRQIVRIERRSDVWSCWALENHLKGFDELTRLVSLIVLMIGGFAISMTLGRVVSSQRREIGVLMAMGTARKTILLYYLAFGILLGVSGSLAGMAFGFGVSYWMVNYYGLSLHIPFVAFTLTPAIYLQGLCFGLVISILFSLLPAIRASRLMPTEAMIVFSMERPGGLVRRITRRSPLTIKMAVRNMARRRIRSLLTSVGIGLSLIIPISIGSIFSSIDYTIEVGFDNERWDQVITFTHKVNESRIEEIQSIENVSRAEPVLFTYGLINDRYYVFRGIDPADTLARLNIVKGSRFTSPRSMIVDEKVAEEQHLHVGQMVKVRFAGNVTEEFEISGINSVILQGVCYLPLETLQDSTHPNKISGALVVGDAKDALALPYVQDVTEKDRARENLHDMIMEFSPFLYIFLLLGSFIALSILMTAVIVNIEEREIELGTLKALGAGNGLLISSLMVETLLLSLIGGLIALLLGPLTSRYTLKAFSSGLFTLYLHIPPEMYALYYLLAIALAEIACLIISRRITHLRVNEIVKEVSR